MPTQNKYPVSVQQLTTGDTNLDRVQSNIITPLNKTLTMLNASPVVNYVPMGSRTTTSLTAGTWNNLSIDNVNSYYYMNDVDTSMIYAMLVVNSTTAGTCNFRLTNAANSQVVWISSPVAIGTVVSGGTFVQGVYTLSKNQRYVMQVQPTVTGRVDCMVAMKVAY